MSSPTRAFSATALSGKLCPTDAAQGKARFICRLACSADVPAAVEIRYLYDGEERQDQLSGTSLRPVSSGPIGTPGALFDLEREVDASEHALLGIHIYTIDRNDVRVEVQYGEDYFAKHLYFLSKRDFERGFFIRRRRAKDEETLLFCAEQLTLHYRLSPAHRAVAAVVYGYRTIDVGDRWRAGKALTAVDQAFEDASRLETTQHPRTDRDHLLQSLQMAKWQLQVFLLNEAGLMQTLVATILRTSQLKHPLAINTYNGCRMYLVGGFLLHKAGLTTQSIQVLDAGIALFTRAMANERQAPNPQWAFPQSDIDETQAVVDRMARFVQKLRRGEQDLGEQDEVVLSATRLLKAESREVMRRNFARLVGRVVKDEGVRDSLAQGLASFTGAAGD